MLYFKEELEKLSENAIAVELYFGGILGKESEVLDMVKNGTIQGCRGGLFARANTKYILYTLPFIFNTTEQAVRLAESHFGKTINTESIYNGYYIPACGIAGGFRNITNNIHPIESPDDFINMKLRTPPIEITIETFKILGAVPQEIAYTETYFALEKGIVDGQENPLSNIVDMKFYEVQKFLSIVNWQIHPDPLYVNPDWYNSLPGELKKLFDDVAGKSMQYSNELWFESENEYFTFLEDKIIINTISDDNLSKFKEAVKPVWQHYIDHEYFTWDDVDTVLSIINTD